MISNKLPIFLCVVLTVSLIITSLIPGFPAQLDRHMINGIRLDYFTHALSVFLIVVSSGICVRTVCHIHAPVKAIIPFSILAAAVLLEYLQKLIPWRGFNPLDIMSEIIGAAFSIPLYILIVRKKTHS